MMLDVLAGQRCATPPVWMMRQAGRYLPEYRAVREKTGSFLNLCFTPELAAEVTLQPIRRFNLDAAILFSDILVVPHALGQTVTFVAGEGPRLAPLIGSENVGRFAKRLDLSKLGPVFETIRLAKPALPEHVALLGFCGAPWTVATYMVAGQGTPDQGPARVMAYRDPAGFARLIDALTDASIEYLVEQFRSGVDAVQVFDTGHGADGKRPIVDRLPVLLRHRRRHRVEIVRRNVDADARQLVVDQPQIDRNRLHACDGGHRFGQRHCPRRFRAELDPGRGDGSG